MKPAADRSLSSWRTGLHWARLIFTPLSLVVIALLIWDARAALGDMARGGAWHYLLAALLLWLLGNLVAPLVSVQLFASFGIGLRFSEALDIHASRLPAKYLPGGIWHSVGRANDYFALGYGSRDIWIYFLMENFLIVAVPLTLSAAVVAPLIAVDLLREALSWLPVLLGVLVVMFPVVLRVVTRHSIELVLVSYYAALAASVSYWLVVGLAFTCYIRAFQGLDVMASSIETAAVYIFSWCLGYLALFAPQGIGVAEFVSGTLLANSRAAEFVAFLIGFRVLVLVGDLLSWVLVSILHGNK